MMHVIAMLARIYLAKDMAICQMSLINMMHMILRGGADRVVDKEETG